MAKKTKKPGPQNRGPIAEAPKSAVGYKRPPVEHQFKPGEGGRPKGARNKLSETFIDALYEHFLVSGKKAIEDCAILKPDVYVKVIADLCRKEIIVSREDEAFDKLSDHEIDQVIADAIARRGNLERERDRLLRQENKQAAAGTKKPDRVH